MIDKSIPYEPGSDFIFEKGIMYIKVSRIGLNATLIGGFLWIEEAGSSITRSFIFVCIS